MSTESLEQLVNRLQEENESLRKQINEPDLRAFEQIRELRATNKKLTDEMKRLTTECVQLAFKARQTEAELKDSRATGDQLGHSLEELQSELSQSKDQLSQSKEVVLSHENELSRQKEELAQRQQQMTQLQEELNQREGRISKLENLVNELKDQFLSDESFMDVDAPSATGRPYQIMVSHMQKLLGFSGQTVVDQVFSLTGADPGTTDPHKIEEIYEALQDTAAAFVRGTEHEGSLQSELESCWSEIHGGESARPAPAPAPALSVPVEPTPAPEPEPQADLTPEEEATAELFTPEPAVEPEPVVEPEQPEAEIQPELVVEPEPTAEEAVAEEAPAQEAPAPEAPAAEAPAAEAPAAAAPAAAAPAAAAPLALELEVEPEAPVESTASAEPETEPETQEESSQDQPLSLSQEKAALIREGVRAAQADPEGAKALLEEALAAEVWVEEEAQAHLALARLKAGREPILEHLISCLPWVEVPDFFDLLPHGEAADEASQNICQLLLSLGSQPRSESLQLEAKLGLGGRSANRDMVGKIGYEEEEQLVEVLLDQVLPKSGLKLALPGEIWDRRREQSSPAAFVGTLRQALRGVDYTLFDFHQLEVLSYDGEEKFLVDSTIEPNLGLMFHKDVEGTVPEEVRFLAFRRLVQMYRKHTNLAQLAHVLDDEARVALLRGTIALYEEEQQELDAALRDRADHLEPGSEGFRSQLTALLRDLYEATELEAFLDLSDWLFGQQLVLRRLSPMADHFASKVVGFTTATYATLRDELSGNEELFPQLESEGIHKVFAENGQFGAARLRLQRFWAEALQASLA